MVFTPDDYRKQQEAIKKLQEETKIKREQQKQADIQKAIDAQRRAIITNPNDSNNENRRNQLAYLESQQPIPEEKPSFTGEKEVDKSYNIPQSQRLTTIKNNQGNVVGVNDPLAQQSYATKTQSEESIRKFEQQRFSPIAQEIERQRAVRKARENLRPKGMPIEEFRIIQGYATQEEKTTYLKKIQEQDKKNNTQSNKYNLQQTPIERIQQKPITQRQMDSIAYTEAKQRAANRNLVEKTIKENPQRTAVMIKENQSEKQKENLSKYNKDDYTLKTLEGIGAFGYEMVGYIPQVAATRIATKAVIANVEKYIPESKRQYKNSPTSKFIANKVLLYPEQPLKDMNLFGKKEQRYNIESDPDLINLGLGLAFMGLGKYAATGVTKTGLAKKGAKAFIARMTGNFLNLLPKVFIPIETVNYIKNPTPFNQGRVIGSVFVGFSPEMIKAREKKAKADYKAEQKLLKTTFIETGTRRHEYFNPETEMNIIKDITDMDIIGVKKGEAPRIIKQKAALSYVKFEGKDKNPVFLMTGKSGKATFKGYGEPTVYADQTKGFKVTGFETLGKKQKLIQIFTQEVTSDGLESFHVKRIEGKLRGYKNPFDLKMVDINKPLKKGQLELGINKNIKLVVSNMKKTPYFGKKGASYGYAGETTLGQDTFGRGQAKRTLTSTYHLTPEEYLGYLRRKEGVYNLALSEKQFNRVYANEYQKGEVNNVLGFFQKRRFFQTTETPIEVSIKVVKGKKTGKIIPSVEYDGAANGVEMPFITYKNNLGNEIKGYKVSHLGIRATESGKILLDPRGKNVKPSLIDQIKYKYFLKQNRMYSTEADTISHELKHYDNSKWRLKLPDAKDELWQAYIRSNPFETYKVTDTRTTIRPNVKEQFLFSTELANKKVKAIAFEENFKEISKDIDFNIDKSNIVQKQKQKSILPTTEQVFSTRQNYIQESKGALKNKLMLERTINNNLKSLVTLRAPETVRQQKPIQRPTYKQITVQNLQTQKPSYIQSQGSILEQAFKPIQMQAFKQTQKPMQIQAQAKKPMQIQAQAQAQALKQASRQQFKFPIPTKPDTPIFIKPPPIPIFLGMPIPSSKGKKQKNEKKGYFNELTSFIDFVSKNPTLNQNKKEKKGSKK